MGTPFITFLEPSKLEGYISGAPRDSQPPSIPSAFLDAMEVRERVFVEEQGVKAEFEFDGDDPRCCHWVVYASVNKTEELEVRDEGGNVVQPRKSSTRSTPIGTIRLVPFPHEAHPKPGGHYYNGLLEGETESQDHLAKYITDRATTFHDGKEPYVKLGRLAVIPEFRGHRVAGLLVSSVLGWLRNNPSCFDPSIKEMGLAQLGAKNETDIPKWNGLVCVHAQEQVVGAWSKWGFKTDEGMGKWWEEGMAHVGMFQRIETVPKQVLI